MYNTIASICSDLLTQLWSVESAENSPHMIFIRPSAAQGSPVLWRFWAASPGTTLNIQARIPTFEGTLSCTAVYFKHKYILGLGHGSSLFGLLIEVCSNGLYISL